MNSIHNSQFSQIFLRYIIRGYIFAKISITKIWKFYLVKVERIMGRRIIYCISFVHEVNEILKDNTKVSFGFMFADGLHFNLLFILLYSLKNRSSEKKITVSVLKLWLCKQKIGGSCGPKSLHA